MRSLEIGFLAWDAGGRFVAAAVLLGAALYELTPVKDVCLSECRDPLAFLLHSWRPGPVGALRMGIAHGAWGVGGCWALMAALFALPRRRWKRWRGISRGSTTQSASFRRVTDRAPGERSGATRATVPVRLIAGAIGPAPRTKGAGPWRTASIGSPR